MKKTKTCSRKEYLKSEEQDTVWKYTFTEQQKKSDEAV